MAQVQQNFDTWKSKLDKALHEKNAVTDLLDKIEKKTNVRRLYIVLGETRKCRIFWSRAFLLLLHQFTRFNANGLGRRGRCVKHWSRTPADPVRSPVLAIKGGGGGEEEKQTIQT